MESAPSPRTIAMNSIRLAFSLVAFGALVPAPHLAAEEKSDGAALYNQCVKSVVFIANDNKGDPIYGAGTLIDAGQRLVLTCAHFVAGTDTVAVQFPVRLKGGVLETEKRNYIQRVKDGLAIKGTVLFRDKTRDLALVKLEQLPPDTPALPVARTSPRVGERVMNIGSPQAVDWTFATSEGDVRGVGVVEMVVGGGDEVLRIKARVIQVTNPVCAGGFGGAVIDQRGYLVGVEESGRSGVQNVNNAIDVTEVRAFLKESKVTIKELGDAKDESVKPAPKKEPQGGKEEVKFDASALYEKCVKSCTFVYTPLKEGHAEGSGTLIDVEQRLVLTSFHVVAGSDTVFVQFPVRNKDGELMTDKKTYIERVKAGQTLEGKVLHVDKTRDLALIQLSRLPENTPALSLAETSIKTGAEIIKIGSPGKSAMFVMSHGKVRSVGSMDIPTSDETLRIKVRMVQLTNPDSVGDSGGPVVDRRGWLVAVTDYNYSPTGPQNLNQAVDVTEVHAFLKENKVILKPPPDPRPPPMPPRRYPPPPEMTDEQMAAMMFRRAKLFAEDADSREVYVRRLKELVNKYPSTPAAKEAKKLLDEMKK